MKYTVRACQTRDELAAAVRVQQEIWGYADREVYPLRLFVNLTRMGGHVLGAFTLENDLVGFVASMPAWRGAKRYYHSLSLGVLPEHENRGLGRALKLEQRKAALATGIDLIEWTFDPLRVKNAFLNIVRLGAVSRRYYPNYYGPVESRFQQDLESDRLVGEWWLNSPRARRALRAESPRGPRRKPAAEVFIPTDIDTLLRQHPSEARAVQFSVREQLLKYFLEKLEITGFVQDPQGCRYLLDPYED